MQKQEPLNPKQIAEWTENPVTELFLSLVKRQLEELKEAKSDAFHPFEPQKTQETMAQIEGAIDSWEIVADILTGDWTYLEEDDEQVRDYPEGE